MIKIINDLDTLFVGDLVFDDCINLMNINCNSSHYQSESGVLMTSQRDSIVIFPPASPNKYFAIPFSVKTINSYAFYKCNNLISVMIMDNSVNLILASASEKT